MIGDTVVVNGVEFEVVWSGGEGLIPDRESKPDDCWKAPPRLYNKSGKFLGFGKVAMAAKLAAKRAGVDKDLAMTEDLEAELKEDEAGEDGLMSLAEGVNFDGD